MKNQVSLLLSLCASAFSLATIAQNLPDEYYFSQDGHILELGGSTVTGLYQEDVIRTVELQFDQPDYWQQLTDNYDDQINIPATLWIDGELVGEVGVRFKGQTSYFMTGNSLKKSFSIKLDEYVPDQNYMGYESLNLNNGFLDPSFMREIFYLHQIRQHIPAAKASYTRLFINGEDWGLYPSIQQLNSQFIEEWYQSSDGDRWRADTQDSGPGGGGPGGGGGGPQWGDGTAALNYLGTDPAEYQQYYTLKNGNSVDPWQNLINTCEVVDNIPLSELEAQLPGVLDVDRTLWFLACEIAFSDDDGYVYKGKMDYYLYWDPETGRMTPLEYDGNTVMESQNQNWSVFYHAENANYPLLNRMLAIPAWRQRYLAHMRTIVNELLDPESAAERITWYGDLIDAEVASDPIKFYSYPNFISEQSDLIDFITYRHNYLGNNVEMNVESPVITGVEMESGAGVWLAPVSGESVLVRASATHGSGIQDLRLYYSDQLTGTFAWVSMLDDGQNGDDAAGDGEYVATIPGFPSGSPVRFYVEAIADNAAGTRAYSPVGAEHDVYYYTVTTEWAEEQLVVINELMASNQNTMQDEAGEYDDWIELYNASSNSVDLSGWFLSDDPLNLDKWEIPAGSVIPADSYMIIWADENGTQGEMHANFKLDVTGESVLLLTPELLLADEVYFGAQQTDMGYARNPNGFGPFVIQSPTFMQNNDLANGLEDETNLAGTISTYPNPTSGILRVNGEASYEVLSYMIYDMTGRLSGSGLVGSQGMIDIHDLQNGVYVLVIDSLIVRIIKQ